MEARAGRSVTPSTQKIQAAAFSTPTRAVGAGEGGTMVVSDDTAATWHPVGKRLSATFSRVRALSPSVVFATGPSGALARSDDGGVTWTEVGVSTSEDVIDVSFADPRHRVRPRRGGDAAAHRQLGSVVADPEHGHRDAAAGRARARDDRSSCSSARRACMRSTDGGNTFIADSRPAAEPVQALQRRPRRSVRVRLRLEEHPRLDHRRAHLARRSGCRARR